MNDQSESRRIRILRDSVAQRIAAGEVIDRPYSVVRELLDNAIDAGAAKIDLYLERGGLDRVRVVDDGEGMSREDVDLCWQPHATSKIETAEDIYALSTLGFRGEALSSVASCARLTVTSAPSDGIPHTLEVHGGKKIRLEAGSGSRGTAVDVADLFFNMPGRRRFLKSAGAESSACKRTFLEKALPFPSVGFRLFIDGELRLFLPPASRRERIARAHPEALPEDFLYERQEEGGRFRLHTVLSSPSLVRRDRRYIHIYLNRRRISEYSLVQAVQYAYGEYLPGGKFPAAFIFAEVDPALVDFNIHPAKREARIKNLPDIHHQLVHLIGRFLAENFPHTSGDSEVAETPDFEWGEESHTAGRGGKIAGGSEAGSAGAASGASYGASETAARREVDIEAWKRIGRQAGANRQAGEMRQTGDYRQTGGRSNGGPAEETAEETAEASAVAPAESEGPADSSKAGRPLLLGQAFGLFIAVEYGSELFLIDQHAAHERIIYDRISAPGQARQNLLVPMSFETEEEETSLLLQRQEEFAELGVELRRTGERSWELTAIPERWTGMEEELIEFLSSATVPGETLRSELYADLACKTAVKDGEQLDAVSAEELARQALTLPVPRCPHGRPVWHRISREELLRSVGRI